MKFLLTAALALLAAPSWAQTSPQSLMDQALLLGPARMEDAGGQLTLFGESGTMSYVAVAIGSDCGTTGSACDEIRFQAVAPPSSSAGDPVAEWQDAGLGGSLAIGPDGWLVLTDEASLGDAAEAFGNWGRLMDAFQDLFGR